MCFGSHQKTCACMPLMWTSTPWNSFQVGVLAEKKRNSWQDVMVWIVLLSPHEMGRSISPQVSGWLSHEMAMAKGYMLKLAKDKHLSMTMSLKHSNETPGNSHWWWSEQSSLSHWCDFSHKNSQDMQVSLCMLCSHLWLLLFFSRNMLRIVS